MKNDGRGIVQVFKTDKKIVWEETVTYEKGNNLLPVSKPKHCKGGQP